MAFKEQHLTGSEPIWQRENKKTEIKSYEKFSSKRGTVRH
jgi:hypothetical protein